MNSTKNTADRVRPFLRAMEESISAARQQRLNGGVEPVAKEPPSVPTPSATPTPPLTPQPRTDSTVSADEPAPRLRARPKRPSSFLTSYEESRAQTRAG